MNPAWRLLITCIVLAAAVPACSAPAGSRSDEVMQLVNAMSSSPRVRVLPSGTSLCGRSIPAYIISDFTVDSSSKTRIFICSGQHGNELDPMRSVLALSCRLASGSELDLLKQCVFIVVPMVNPDGVAAATRLSGGNYDLNRGWRNLASLESKYVDGLIKTWRPHLLIDVHEQTTHIPAGGNFIEAPHCLTTEHQEATNFVAARISMHTGLRLATCDALADKQLFHRNYACLGYGAYLLETAMESTYPAKDNLYTSAILELSRIVANDNRLRAALSPSASGFDTSSLQAYLRPNGPASTTATAPFYALLALCTGYTLCLWLIRPSSGGRTTKWSRRFVKCEVDQLVPTHPLTARHTPTPLTVRSWVHRRLRSRYSTKPARQDNRSNASEPLPQGTATFITPRYPRERTGRSSTTQRA